MKFTTITLGIILALSCSVFADPQCHTSEFMQCVDIAVNWLHTLPKQSLPETDDEIVYECQELTKAIECGLKYKDSCMTPLQKEFVGLLLDGVFEYRDSFCEKGSALRTKYLTHATCLNKVSKSEGVKEQIEYILAVVENMVSQKDSDKIMYACCGYRKIHGEFLKMSLDTCGKEATDMVIEFISMFMAQLPDVLCNSMDGTEDRCQKLLPPPGTKVSSDLKNTALFEFIEDALSNWIDL
ncbi:hypothetical protein JTE90_014089 [Oedothorax gibbosus]|uniref:Uncharacterized protein n=1 Tax=Oedothorax gibbosus TaxID=931172 RepID=A0AAV6V8I4_9ARAC|nr:hypothetical protein JTE90_014089 [Oedothorax gibbosus]